MEVEGDGSLPDVLAVVDLVEGAGQRDGTAGMGVEPGGLVHVGVGLLQALDRHRRRLLLLLLPLLGSAVDADELLEGHAGRAGTSEPHPSSSAVVVLVVSTVVTVLVIVVVIGPADADSTVVSQVHWLLGAAGMTTLNLRSARAPRRVSRRAVLVVAVAVGVGPGKVLEVGVVAGLLGRDAAGRVVDEEHLEEVEALLVEVGAQGCLHVALPLGERGLEVGVRGNAGPDVLGGSAQETASRSQRPGIRSKTGLETAHTGRS